MRKNTRSISDYGRMTQRAVAKVFGVTEQAVSNWCNRDGGPRNRDRSLDLAKIIGWRIARLTEDMETAASGPSEQLERWRRIRSDHEQFRLDQDREKFIERAEHVRIIDDFANRLKREMIFQSRFLPPLLEGRTMQEMSSIITARNRDQLRCWSMQDAPAVIEANERKWAIEFYKGLHLDPKDFEK